VQNVLQYLADSLTQPETIGQTLDIGGLDVMSYREIMNVMAECLGLRRRLVIPVPVLTPRLSSLWIHLVTPLSHRIARPLAEGLKNRVVCRDGRARELLPQQLLGVRESIEAALGNLQSGSIETSWSDAGPIPGDPDWAGGTQFVDRRSTEVAASPKATFMAVNKIGGTHGWYAANFLWRLRGALDRLVGGPGLRRGRRNEDYLAFGDALDFWRVTGVEPDRRVRLRAEMKLPGIAELEFEVQPAEEADRCLLVQTARFKPSGLGGLVYWYLVKPFHGWVFRGMLRGIAESAERSQ
jgi:hypothetical protein